MMKILRCIAALLGIAILAALAMSCYNFFAEPIEKPPAYHEAAGEFRIYYLLNIDGMKGLGHSALLLQRDDGSARVFSYNGMQYGLADCLRGKAGVGKMREIDPDSEALAEFFRTGNLATNGECDNFDRAFYRDMTGEQYEQILEEIRYYMEVGDEFERLCAGDAEEAVAFAAREDIPKYQIYHHNCDTVARELMAIVFDEIAEYNEKRTQLTPGGNYRRLIRRLGDEWGVITLGQDSVFERLLANY